MKGKREEKLSFIFGTNFSFDIVCGGMRCKSLGVNFLKILLAPP